MVDKTITNPGFHKQFVLSRFGEEEQSILNVLSKGWYLTNSGEEIYVAQSKYNYFLMKPTPRTSEMFNIEREVICVLSSYENFEPRSLDIFDEVIKKLPKMRTETVCGVLVSRANNVEKKVEQLLKSDPEHQIIVPVTYKELLEVDAIRILENRFRKHFYSRDLFSFLSPLKKDTYFFGRSNLISEIVNRYQSGEHTSLFGLRKSGKTSIVYAIERRLLANGDHVVSLDCENPSIHMLRWYELLEKLVHEYHTAKESKAKIITSERYTEKLAADSFELDMLKIYSSKKAASTLFIFDEIERLTPNTASSSHWREGDDFIFFWQTMRGFYQKNPQVFSYMLVGTNPSCIESSMLLGHDNPIYASIPSQYVPPFTVDQVTQMVTKLGDYMGLKFDTLISAKLTEDFGGHPFLIRQMCSQINKLARLERPVKIEKVLYNRAKEEFVLHSQEYLEMMIQVLFQWYPDEYDMLRFLAQGDIESFNALALDHSNYTRHLVGYGLVQKSADGYAFNLEAIAKLLRDRHKNERLNLSQEEKVQEISQRRNKIEKDLRTLVKNVLKISKGPKKGAEAVISSVPDNRKLGMQGKDLNNLLDRDRSPLFFLELINIIKREWELFENVFPMEKAKVLFLLEEINAKGRPDAHAKSISEDDFQELRLYFKKIETILNDWAN